ncbi:unannotated protein [freshwater metagenome]|uniref:Unannotated protein n=1 Tax=freshwater metagenome TaxID=449393 RepID=A0A6J7E1Y0_9ZZZZ
MRSPIPDRGGAVAVPHSRHHCCPSATDAPQERHAALGATSGASPSGSGKVIAISFPYPGAAGGTPPSGLNGLHGQACPGHLVTFDGGDHATCLAGGDGHEGEAFEDAHIADSLAVKPGL